MGDYSRWYENVSAPFRNDTSRRLINYADKALVILFAASYICALIALLASQDARAFRFFLVPAIVFAIVTAMRVLIGAKRPYELYDIDALVQKDTRGKSLPSRHMASAVVIACGFAWLNAGAGIAAFLCCAIVAFTRIVGGVHFPRDIVAATAVAAAIGIVGFFLIP